MYIDFNFSKRLSELRTEKGVSARDMSLSLGQNPTYIHKIENGIALPSMMGFFYICEYLDIEPADFFSRNINSPVKLKELTEDAQHLNREQLEHIHLIVKDLLKSTGKK
ncbi:helix-turn-helix transcriptional regulator [Clostridium sp. HBUAS56010]|uniref:helix-turn-helix domain-containing protein n=1 Tax=Clostridium sp. HBUAS56010 TaxID=2571127 RepID=UPI0011786357|nr:helix-turn-helix transcriptional regulator [Clostridium sp. HBUAS56010]